MKAMEAAGDKEAAVAARPHALEAAAEMLIQGMDRMNRSLIQDFEVLIGSGKSRDRKIMSTRCQCPACGFRAAVLTELTGDTAVGCGCSCPYPYNIADDPCCLAAYNTDDYTQAASIGGCLDSIGCFANHWNWGNRQRGGVDRRRRNNPSGSGSCNN